MDKDKLRSAVKAELAKERWVKVGFTDGTQGVALDEVTALDFVEAALASLPAAPAQPHRLDWMSRPMASIPLPNDSSRRVVGFVIPNEGADMPSAQLERILAAPTQPAEQVQPVAWHIGNPDGTMSTFGATYRSREYAEHHIASYGGMLKAAIVPLYAAPSAAPVQAEQ